MVPLESRLENREDLFAQWNDVLQEYEFTLGGGWEYDHGYFDCSLDEEQKVWLRIPFEVTHGRLEGEARDAHAVIRLGQPFVLRHLYNDGLDGQAEAKIAGSLLDQFQEPVDENAAVGSEWVDKAKSLLSRVEQGVLH